MGVRHFLGWGGEKRSKQKHKRSMLGATKALELILAVMSNLPVGAFQENGEYREQNLAVSKGASYCGIRPAPWLADRDRRTARAMYDACEDRAYVEVFMQRVEYVHYVIVYQGEQSKGELDYFKVYQVIMGELIYCSEFEGKAADSVGVGMTVNCKARIPTKKVRIYSRRNEGLVVSEIEIYTLFGDAVGGFLLGCFGEFNGSRPLEDVGDDPEMCWDACHKSSAYGAITRRMACLCSNDFDWKHQKSRKFCEVPCFEHGICGGSASYLIYLANVFLPNFLGCHVVPSEPERIFENNTSVGGCIERCQSFNYAFVWNASYCGCSDDLPAVNGSERHHDRCDSPCPGNGNQRCGGGSFSSVYGTCRIKDGPGYDCGKVFHCQHGMDQLGRCQMNEACRGEFYGLRCIFRNADPCSVHTCQSNAVCVPSLGSVKCICMTGYDAQYEYQEICVDHDECAFVECEYNQECENMPGSYQCLCAAGYGRIDDSDPCHDIDECLDNPCQNMPCTNTDGSYFCECRGGYSYSNVTGECRDVNECESNECDNETSTCVNAPGTFECRCRPHFIQTEDRICLKKLQSRDEHVPTQPLKVELLYLLVFVILAVYGVAILTRIIWKKVKPLVPGTPSVE